MVLLKLLRQLLTLYSRLPLLMRLRRLRLLLAVSVRRLCLRLRLWLRLHQWCLVLWMHLRPLLVLGTQGLLLRLLHLRRR